MNGYQRPTRDIRSSFVNLRKLVISWQWVWSSRLGSMVMKPSFEADRIF